MRLRHGKLNKTEGERGRGGVLAENAEGECWQKTPRSDFLVPSPLMGEGQDEGGNTYINNSLQ